MKVKEENVPVLRFPGFSGEWSKEVLGKVFRIFNGYAFSSTDAKDNGALWVKIADVGICKMKTDNLSFLPVEYLSKYKKFVLHKGDFVVALTRPILNGKLKISRIDNNFNNSLLNQRVGKLISDNDLEFIFSMLQKPRLISYIENSIAGTDPPNFAPSSIKNIRVYVPQVAEQQKIASFLTAVNSKIEQLSKKKALLEQYKKGMMQKLFSQEIRFKDEQGNEFPDWEEKRLKDCCQINPKTTELPAEFVYIDLESVANGVLLKENTILEANAPSRAQRLLSKSDVLFQTVRPYQKNNYYFDQDGNYVASTGYAQLRSQESALFLYQIIHTNSFVNRVMARCTGTSYPTINSRDLGEIPVLIPTVPEQRKIATFLSSIDKKINLISTELNHAQAFKKSLLQQMFV